MSLVGFRAQNHPQQATRPDVDDRALPPEDFARLHERFGFTLDAAATPVNAKLPRFFTEQDDGLRQSWWGHKVYCNPPYSNIRPWVEKAWSERESFIVMLLPANRTEQLWWQELIEPQRDKGAALRVEFLQGRMRFIQAGRDVVGPNERPPFGCCLCIWDHDYWKPGRASTTPAQAGEGAG